MFKKLDTTILRVHDILSSKKWYEDTLKLPSVYFDSDEKLAVLDTGQGSTLTIWQIKPGEELIPATSTGCYPIFTVGDAQRIRQHLIEKGVKTGDLRNGNGVVYFHFFDPDGNLLEACQIHE